MKSMTGYGSADGTVGKGELYIEIKTINHRYQEIGLKIPPRMSSLEKNLRKELQKSFLRGKIELYIREKKPLFGEATFAINEELLHNFQKTFKKLRQSLSNSISNDFLQYVGIEKFIAVEERKGSYEKLSSPIVALLIRAIKQVEKMRVQEGKNISLDQKKRLQLIRSHVKKIRLRSLATLEDQMDRIKKKVSQGGGYLDEERLQAEALYLGGRQDVAEELTRLESHLQQYLKLINEKAPVGRRLDFLLQEMNREINTIGSKSSDAHISNIVVESKSELERLREQVQNIE
ncbi:MAG: YicC family protein [Deltaproteobacteria bacterium CG_4_10_14_0_2_um_filter_43_8]|nr:MAG: YicC family protein [Deltaproteobacteria bacterium CG11_big_fil_rev_8_21_14_0_20_42_23]PJA18983.1 MAG: YicC family protein [Deltaproteobacteria bacterium CG_4_10_14_0_2_um_filter_43_8]PJC63751.1 MAG: YicC family protein [Deltaproteobacteria bacterium CG_4_9_14_0_2_um_filter_42_21]